MDRRRVLGAAAAVGRVLGFDRATLVKAGVLSAAQADELVAQVAKEMDAAVTFAVNSPYPKLESALENVYA